MGLTNNEYSIALTVTYISFIFAEWPSVMLCKKMWVRQSLSYTLSDTPSSGFNYGLPALCIAWGLVCTFQGFVHNYGGLVAARAPILRCIAGHYLELVTRILPRSLRGRHPAGKILCACQSRLHAQYKPYRARLPTSRSSIVGAALASALPSSSVLSLWLAHSPVCLLQPY